MRRQSSSKRHYFRGGEVKNVKNISDLCEPYTKYTVYNKNVSRIIEQGELSKLTTEYKNELLNTYVENKNYEFYVM